jgi:putative tricarboxylic transport membrane protein
MGKADRISGAFWFVFGIFITLESYRMGLGTLRRPGPGFLFFWAGILMAVLSLVVLSRAWADRRREALPTKAIFGPIDFLKIALVSASVFLYAFFMERLGFIPITLILLLFLLGVMERKKIAFTVLFSIVVTAAAYLIFEVLLHSQLPKGFLGF